jgi:hypothetical protein
MMKLKINWGIKRVIKSFTGLVILIALAIYMFVDTYIFRHRVQLKDDGSYIGKNSIVTRAGEWCKENKIKYTIQPENVFRFSFLHESDAMAFKIVWAEYVE